MTLELFTKTFKGYLKNENVSRETLEKFFHFYLMLEKYKKSISMIRYSDLDELIWRHFIDSYQLCNIIPKKESLVDMGSGAGFPAIILSIMGYNVTAIESNFKKSFFLSEVARELDLPLTIFNGRVENCSQKFEFITARALTSVINLLSIAQDVSRETSHAFFLKGKNAQKEIEEACKIWQFKSELIASSTNEESTILHIWDWKKHGASYSNS